MNTNWKEQVQQVLETAVSGGEVPGVSVLVLQDGKEELFAAAGYADVEGKKPYERDTIVRLYSMSKPFTGVAVLLLLERGQLELNDAVEWYLPGFANARVYRAGGGTEPAWRPVTVRDLVSMSAGLAYPGPEDAAGLAAGAVLDELSRRLYTDQAMTTVEAANALGRQPLAFQPGSHFRYSTCADVAGAVVEVVSGMPYGEFLRREIAEPLGLTDTGFYVPPAAQPRLAKAYERRDGAFREFRTDHLGMRYQRDAAPAFESGGAGMVGTITDYARFASMLLNGGELDGVRILRPQTVRYLAGGQLDAVGKADLQRWSTDRLIGYNYSFFHRVLEEEGRSVCMGAAGEYGWDDWLGTYYVNDPKNRLTFVLFSQVPGAGNTRTVRRVRNVVWSALGRQ